MTVVSVSERVSNGRVVSERRREMLLQDLEEIFLVHGFRSLSVEDIAAALECSRSTIYALAPTKEQLVVTAFERFFSGMDRRIDSRIRRAQDHGSLISGYVAAMSDELRRMSPECRQDILRYEPVAEMYRVTLMRWAFKFRELLGHCAKDGLFDASRVAFLGGAVSLLIEEIIDGRLPARTGLTDADAFDELSLFIQG